MDDSKRETGVNQSVYLSHVLASLRTEKDKKAIANAVKRKKAKDPNQNRHAKQRMSIRTQRIKVKNDRIRFTSSNSTM